MTNKMHLNLSKIPLNGTKLLLNIKNYNKLPINLSESDLIVTAHEKAGPEVTVMILNFGQIGPGKQCRPRSDCS